MSIKGVLKNIRSKGIAGTYRIYAGDKDCGLSEDEVIAVKAKRLEAAKLTKQALEETGADARKIARIDEVIRNMEKTGTKRSGRFLSRWNSEIQKAETSALRDWMRALFIKERMPAAYDAAKTQPVEDKIVLMQRGKGLGSSYRYVYNRIKKDYPFEPVLCEFHHAEVSYAEHFLNAEEFAREAATARAIFVHTQTSYLGYLDIRPETKVVQIWHGCGVIKHLGLTTAGDAGARDASYWEEYPQYNKYDVVTICSEEQRWVFEDFMGKEKGDPVLQPWGMARTDEFYDTEFVERCYDKLHRLIPESKGKKVILYAPTYRGRGDGRVAPRELDIAKFAEKLSDDYILLIKHHQNAKELPEIPEEYRDKFAFDMTRGRGMNIAELMTVADIMISDYSSVIFEYSLFERPIIFFMFDLEEYMDERGMYYSYEELAECGPVFKDNDSMVDYIAHIDERFDKSRVEQFREKFMSACDGHAMERVMKYVMEG